MLRVLKIEEINETVDVIPKLPVISMVTSLHETNMQPQTVVKEHNYTKNVIGQTCKGTSSKSPLKTKSKKGKKMSPRIMYHQDRYGKIIQTRRCITCGCFVKKNQPKCLSCLGFKKIEPLKQPQNLNKQKDPLKSSEKLVTNNKPIKQSNKPVNERKPLKLSVKSQKGRNLVKLSVKSDKKRKVLKSVKSKKGKQNNIAIQKPRPDNKRKAGVEPVIDLVLNSIPETQSKTDFVRCLDLKPTISHESIDPLKCENENIIDEQNCSQKLEQFDSNQTKEESGVNSSSVEKLEVLHSINTNLEASPIRTVNIDTTMEEEENKVITSPSLVKKLLNIPTIEIVNEDEDDNSFDIIQEVETFLNRNDYY